MSDAVWKELRLDKYRALLGGRHLPDGPTALCNERGESIWTAEEAGAPRLEHVLERLREAGFDWGDAGRVEVGDGDALVHQAVPGRNGPQAWLVRLVSEANRVGPSGLTALRATLESVAACIGDEIRLNEELQGVAVELTDRYEELNLIYTLQEHKLERGESAIRAFLEGFSDLMNVDVAAFVTAGPTLPVYTTNSLRPILNLDLLLVALRGDLLRFVMASRKTFVLNSPQDPRRAFILVNMPYKILACPLMDGRNVERMLVLLRQPERPDFSNSDRSLARVVAEQAGLMLRNQGMVDRLERFGQQTAAALVEALEAKDPYTRGHSERVQVVSLELGRAVGFQRAELEDLFWGSIFHDVGKLGVPDAILCKPGRLNADEYDFIKIHPERSYEILKHIEYLRPNALAGARHHHERFDGSGYPHGLAGKAIPEHARIVAVADTYDAITSSRSYRAGRSHEEAMAVIREVAGAQLDPGLVSVLEDHCVDGPCWPEKALLDGSDADG